ncbi:hypothetical protein B7H23_07675 [Notoacmeibacter marinus]|uniref:Uncharacterized protein n=1 Tax=Notoacmeibacter marinus TaxID=1876515 RepID=A0A231V3H9_9HYPH|nr:hypothetical protein [Notoacmeibacter marinus]OXT02743.1 hypothetical protein B7H23_07675 [Notoacmeibacter marinus]
MIQLASHFSHSVANSTLLQQQRTIEFARVSRERDRKKDEAADRSEAELMDLAGTVLMATDQQIAEFEVKLERYDEATVKALMKNGERIEELQAERQAMLEDAHVLEDGRRVFKTEDGTRVYDEHGQRLSEESVNPDAIADYRPRAESYLENEAALTSLEQQRAAILEFQNHVDEAHEQIAEGGISEKDLDELDSELKEMMPDAVRAEMPGYVPAEPVQKLGGQFTKAAAPVMPADLNPANIVPDMQGPGL